MASGIKYRSRPPVRPTGCLNFITAFVAFSLLADDQYLGDTRSQFLPCGRVLALHLPLNPTSGDGRSAARMRPIGFVTFPSIGAYLLFVGTYA